MPPRPIIRPRAMTDELLSTFPALIRGGASVSAACQACGITQTTYYRWRQLGERDDRPWQRQFTQLVDRAQGEYTSALETGLGNVGTNGRRKRFYKYVQVTDPQTGTPHLVRTLDREVVEDDPSTAMAILERRHPSEWAKRDRLEVSGPDGGPIETLSVGVSIDYDRLPIELKRRMLAEFDQHQRLTDDTERHLVLELERQGVKVGGDGDSDGSNDGDDGSGDSDSHHPPYVITNVTTGPPCD